MGSSSSVPPPSVPTAGNTEFKNATKARPPPALKLDISSSTIFLRRKNRMNNPNLPQTSLYQSFSNPSTSMPPKGPEVHLPQNLYSALVQEVAANGLKPLLWKKTPPPPPPPKSKIIRYWKCCNASDLEDPTPSIDSDNTPSIKGNKFDEEFQAQPPSDIPGQSNTPVLDTGAGLQASNMELDWMQVVPAVTYQLNSQRPPVRVPASEEPSLPQVAERCFVNPSELWKREPDDNNKRAYETSEEQKKALRNAADESVVHGHSVPSNVSKTLPQPTVTGPSLDIPIYFSTLELGDGFAGVEVPELTWDFRNQLPLFPVEKFTKEAEEFDGKDKWAFIWEDRGNSKEGPAELFAFLVDKETPFPALKRGHSLTNEQAQSQSFGHSESKLEGKPMDYLSTEGRDFGTRSELPPRTKRSVKTRRITRAQNSVQSTSGGVGDDVTQASGEQEDTVLMKSEKSALPSNLKKPAKQPVVPEIFLEHPTYLDTYDGETKFGYWHYKLEQCLVVGCGHNVCEKCDKKSTWAKQTYGIQIFGTPRWRRGPRPGSRRQKKTDKTDGDSGIDVSEDA